MKHRYLFTTLPLTECLECNQQKCVFLTSCLFALLASLNRSPSPHPAMIQAGSTHAVAYGPTCFIFTVYYVIVLAKNCVCPYCYHIAFQ